MASGTAIYALLLFLFVILHFMDFRFWILLFMIGNVQAW